MKYQTATLLALFVIITFQPACLSMKRLAPAAGATAGAAAGAVGGVGTAALGAGAGYAVGEVIASDMELAEAEEEVEQARETIAALTKGDVEGLLAARLKESEKSWGDKALGEIKGLLRLAAWVGLLLAVLFVAVPLILHKTGIKKATAEIKKTLPPFPVAGQRSTLETPRENQPHPPR